MCGLVAIYGKTTKEELTKMGAFLSHRGPDSHNSWINDAGFGLHHNRLAIIDLHTGQQPIVENRIGLIHNGEIYNHHHLRNKLKGSWQTTSDSEAILKGYLEWKEKVVHHLDGVFAFVLFDDDKCFAARDPIGVKPLYWAKDQEGRILFASEMKAFDNEELEIKEFPPGHYYTSDSGLLKYYQPNWYEPSIPFGQADSLKEKLISAVEKRLMSDVPLGSLLSGGLDSSLITSIAARLLKNRGKRLRTYSVGLDPQTPDLQRAREVALFLETDHKEIIFTIEEGIALLEELIYKIESYDVTTIRASTPMYIMSRIISQDGIKVVLSGEGADEIFGGYLYFSNAPDEKEFHKECVRRVQRLHSSDVLRADRSTMGQGVEARVPFLDLAFLDIAMNIDPKLKVFSGNIMEKSILRFSFEDKENPWLPQSILWRQKEQFSDGVGYSWIDSLKAYAENTIKDEDFAKASEYFPYNTPLTKEAFLYREIFERIHKNPSCKKNIKRWVPKWQQDIDPSGRANRLHIQAYS